MNNNFFKNLILFLDSVYLSWFMCISCLVTLLFQPGISTFQMILSVTGILLFAPTLYQYHISKTINEFGTPLNDTSK